MTKKRSALFFAAGALFTLILGTVGHFFYEWSGENKIVGIFFPVNESTWEHMKLTLFPTMLYMGVSALFVKSNGNRRKIVSSRRHSGVFRIRPDRLCVRLLCSQFPAQTFSQRAGGNRDNSHSRLFLHFHGDASRLRSVQRTLKGFLSFAPSLPEKQPSRTANTLSECCT